MFLQIAGPQAFAGLFTGNPVADAWEFKGNSLSLLTYVRGTGARNFDVYATEFTVPAASPIINSKIQAGDTVLGLAGKMLDGGTGIYRVLAKYGTDTATYSSSTTLTPPGDGIGSHSAGGGGLGSIQMDRDLLFAGPAYSSSGIVDSSEVFRWTGTIGDSGDLIDGGFGRTNAIFSSPGVLSSFEFLVSLDALVRGGYSVNPMEDGSGIVSVQNIAGGAFNTYTDALIHACITSLGDANGDHKVDGADYTVWADHFGQPTILGAPQGDFNCDGKVDGADYTIWADHFGQIVAAGLPTVSVPEPATALLAALAFAGFLLLVARRRAK